jgi:hypothetical protein
VEPMQDLDLQAPGPATAAGRWRLPKTGERAVLWLHGLADRLDLIPAEFGRDAPVDAADGGALAKEWLRQARLWADHNPEEMLGLKVGAVLLGGALVALIVLVRAIG